MAEETQLKGNIQKVSFDFPYPTNSLSGVLRLQPSTCASVETEKLGPGECSARRQKGFVSRRRCWASFRKAES